MRRWVRKDVATDECRDPRDRKAEIESEWVEWQTRQAEQQANAEIDPEFAICLL